MRKKIQYYKSGFESHSSEIAAICSARLSMVFYRIFKASRKEETMSAQDLLKTLKMAHAYSTFCSSQKLLVGNHFFFEYYLRSYNLSGKFDSMDNLAIDNSVSLIMNRQKCLEKAVEMVKPFIALGRTCQLRLIFVVLLNLKSKLCFKVAKKLMDDSVSQYEYGVCLYKGI